MKGVQPVLCSNLQLRHEVSTSSHSEPSPSLTLTTSLQNISPPVGVVLHRGGEETLYQGHMGEGRRYTATTSYLSSEEKVEQFHQVVAMVGFVSDANAFCSCSVSSIKSYVTDKNSRHKSKNSPSTLRQNPWLWKTILTQSWMD